MNRIPARGLYAVTPADLAGAGLLAAAAAALDGGAVMLQYRAKPRGDRATAEALQRLCAQYATPLIINDELPLAAAVGAAGVHLGRDDAAPDQARQALGARAIIGVSCYNDEQRARAAVTAGADYLACGSLFPSPTKPAAVRCCLDTVASMAKLGRPLVAIGGITLQNAPAVIAAGATHLAVISDLFYAPDIRRRARQYQELFT